MTVIAPIQPVGDLKKMQKERLRALEIQEIGCEIPEPGFW
jgi:hypothetical protein